MANSFQRPAPADFAVHASALSTLSLRKMYHASEKTVRRWYDETGIPRPKLVGGLKAKKRPEGFAINGKSNATLAREEDVSVEIIRRWREELGNKRVRAHDQIPADFAERWQRHSTATMAIHYQRSQKTVCTWARNLGLVRVKGVKVKIREKTVKNRPAASPANRALGHSVARITTPSLGHGEEAARYLQSNRGGGWTVFRCDANGRQDITGKFWIVGTKMRTDAELLEMSTRKGFDPDSWRQLVAA